MTLRLVADNVSELPVGNLMDVAGMARRFADYVDDGKWGEISTVLTVVVTPDGMCIFPWGENPSAYEVMGIFEAAKLQCFADSVAEAD